jgi:hypothetical protein
LNKNNNRNNMKAFHTSLILLLILSTLANAETPPELFRVSKVGADKSELLKVFEQVQLVEGRKGLKPENFEVFQRANEAEYLVYKMIWKYRDSAPSWGKQSEGGGSYGGGSGSSGRYLGADLKTLYWLQTEEPSVYVNDEKIRDLYVVPSDEIKSYTTMLGAQVSVRVLREAPAKEIPKDEFVQRLQAGETWTIPSYKTEECRKCYGDGKLSKMQGEGKCLDCNATGTSEVDLIVRWK